MYTISDSPGLRISHLIDEAVLVEMIFHNKPKDNERLPFFIIIIHYTGIISAFRGNDV